MITPFVSSSARQTEKFAQKLAKGMIELAREKQALVIELIGELGSGKTTFVKGFCKELGIKGDVCSPTFIIEKRYDISAICRFEKLIHIDAYRIETLDGAINLDWQDLFFDDKNIILIEWPDKIRKLLPTKTLSITLKHGEHENERIILHAKPKNSQ